MKRKLSQGRDGENGRKRIKLGGGTNHRELNLMKMDALKEAAILKFLKDLSEKPPSEVDLKKSIEGSSEVVKNFLLNFQKLRRSQNEDFDNVFKINIKENYFLANTIDQVKLMLRNTGFFSNICSDDAQRLRFEKIPEISVNDLNADCIEPTNAMDCCINNNTRSKENLCRAFIDKRVTLRKSRLVPRGSSDPGLCAYCEIFMVGFIFANFKKKNQQLATVINRWKIKKGEVGELNERCLLGQRIKNIPHGVIHPFPRYDKDMWIKCQYSDGNGHFIKALRVKDANLCAPETEETQTVIT